MRPRIRVALSALAVSATLSSSANARLGWIASSSTPSTDRTTLQLRVGLLKPGGGYVVQTMDLEAYVARVLAGEAARASEPAALEALAIAIRTFALANRGRHGSDGFDLCDQTHCQVVRNANAATERAASATAARVLLRHGALASIYYTASCGGRTEVPSAVWPGAEDPPYLPSRQDDACGGTPEWSTEIAAQALAGALQQGGYRGSRVNDVKVVARTSSGRAARLRIDGMVPSDISGQDLRVLVGRALGWQRIKSTAFDVRRSGDTFRFAGHGSGHGVGLCVIGSTRLAASGITMESILNRYFPGLDIAPVPGITMTAATPDVSSGRGRSGEILLSLPDEDEGERAVVMKMARAARDELARELVVPVPPQIRLRFHSSIDDYSRATSQPWFTSGAVLNGEAHLVPLTVLRGRGALEQTIRRELAWMLTAEALASRPLWVRQGAAIHFAARPGPEAGAGMVTTSAPDFVFPGRTRAERSDRCPSDAELSQPVSLGTLSNAYARARLCFEQQIGAGRSWREVK